MKSLLALSASLRARSGHQAALAAAQALCPDGVELLVFEGLAALPAFNPDLDSAEGLPAVLAWRAALKDCAGLLIATPEYAHGMPGALKNALDWVVGSGELVDKPVGLITAAPLQGKSFAKEQLHEVLKTMSARLPPAAWVDLPSLRGRQGIGEAEQALLRQAVAALAAV